MVIVPSKNKPKCTDSEWVVFRPEFRVIRNFPDHSDLIPRQLDSVLDRSGIRLLYVRNIPDDSEFRIKNGFIPDCTFSVKNG